MSASTVPSLLAATSRCSATYTTSISLSQLGTMMTINADLRRERERCSFDPLELTTFWDGGAKKTSHRRELGSLSRSFICICTHRSSSFHGMWCQNIVLAFPFFVARSCVKCQRPVVTLLIALFISYYSFFRDKNAGS